MKHRRLITPLIIVGMLAAIAGPASAATTLKGTVGPGFTISLTKDGRKVTSLTAGTYRIVVTDRSSAHDFVLEGPGISGDDAITGVSETGTKTVTVRLMKGTYRYYCEPHSASMHSTFKVV